MQLIPDVLDVRGVKVRIFGSGDGPAILFLHGATGVPPQGPFFEALGEGHRLIIPEHPGFGASEAPKWIRAVPEVALHYLDLLDALDLKEVALVGQSLGGWIASEIAVRSTKRLRSLTLMAPVGLRVRGTPIADNFMWSPQEAVRNVFHNQELAEQVLQRPISEEQADLNLASQFMAARLGWEPRWHNPVLERWLHRIDVPTQIVWGAQDRFVPPSYAQRWGELIPGSRVALVDECGHLPFAEKPQETARIVRNFIESVR